MPNVFNEIADNAEDAVRDLGNVRSFVLGKVDEAVSAGFTVSDAGWRHPPGRRAG
nr:hypothetical protein [Mycobacterium sp. MS1601]